MWDFVYCSHCGTIGAVGGVLGNKKIKGMEILD